MSSFRIRPRFKHLVDGNKENIESKMLQKLAENENYTVSSLPGHLYIKINPKNIHLWSPQLHVTYEQQEKDVLIRGLYGPNPTLWAIFFFGYISLGLLGLFIGMWGLSRWSLGMSSQMLWTLPIFGFLALLLYLSAQAGQKLGAQEMFDMHHSFEKVLSEHIKVN